MAVVDINWTNVTGFQDYLNIANTATGGWFWTAMNYMIFVIALIIMSNYGMEMALVVGAFAGLLLSLFLAYANLIAWWVAGSFVGILLFIFVYIYWSSSKNP